MAKPWEKFGTPEETPAPGYVSERQEYINKPWDKFKAEEDERSNGQRTRGQNVRLSNASREKREREAEAARGRESMRRAEEVRNMPWYQRFLLSAGRETDKLLAGAGDITDFMQDVTGTDEALYNGANFYAGQPSAKGLLGSIISAGLSAPTSVERTINRRREQDSNDEITQEFRDNQGPAGMFGSASPYMVSGTFGGPLARTAGNNLIRGVETGVDVTRATGRGLTARGVEALSRAPGTLGQIGQKAKAEITDPILRTAARRKKQIETVDPIRQGMLSDTLGGGMLGGIEGAVHYDNSPVEGAIAGTLGSLSGNALRPILGRGPSYYTPGSVEEQVVDRALDEGFTLLPGLRYGSNRNQMFEHGLRRDGDWTDTVGQIDRNNQIIKNRIAMRAAGFDEEVPVSSITPEVLRSHLQNLKSQYQALEADTVAKLDGKTINQISNDIASLKSAQNKNGKQAYALGQDFLTKLRKAWVPQQDARGRLRAKVIEGKEYQTLRRELKEAMDNAYNSENMVAYNALKPMLKALDDGMETGIKSFGGDASAAQWKELNEKYAMSHLVMEHGLDELGRFDGNKMSSWLMSKDAKRLLTDEGGRINDLQFLSKLQRLENQESRFSLAGSGLEATKNSARQTPFQRFMQVPYAQAVPMLSRTYMNLYSRGWPGQTGLLAMNPKGIWSPQLYTRALAQGTQVHPEVIQGAMNTPAYVEEKLRGLYDYASDPAGWFGQESPN